MLYECNTGLDCSECPGCETQLEPQSSDVDVKSTLSKALSDPEKQYISDLTERLINCPDIGNFAWTSTDAAALKSILPFINGLLDDSN